MQENLITKSFSVSCLDKGLITVSEAPSRQTVGIAIGDAMVCLTPDQWNAFCDLRFKVEVHRPGAFATAAPGVEGIGHANEELKLPEATF